MTTPTPMPRDTPRVFYALLREVHAAAHLSASVARVARRGHVRRFVRGRCPSMRRFQASLAEALVRRSIATRLRLPPGQAAQLSRTLAGEMCRPPTSQRNIATDGAPMNTDSDSRGTAGCHAEVLRSIRPDRRNAQMLRSTSA